MPEENTPPTNPQGSFNISSGQPNPPSASAPHEIKLENLEKGATEQSPVKEQTPEELDKKLEEQLAQASPEPPETTAKGSKGKIYLIIGLAVLIVAGGTFAVYKFYFSEESSDSEETADESGLISPPGVPPVTEGEASTDEEVAADEEAATDKEAAANEKTDEEKTSPAEEPSEGMKELEEVIKDLEGIYSPDIEKFDEAVLEEVPEDLAEGLKIQPEKETGSDSDSEEEKIAR